MKKIITRYGMYDLLCKCGNKLLEYKKVRASTRYCYFKQIIDEKLLREYQDDLNNDNPDRVKVLICRQCHYMIGRPVARKGGLAFQLRNNYFIEKKKD